jgi:hypothetical protein
MLPQQVIQGYANQQDSKKINQNSTQIFYSAKK